MFSTDYLDGFRWVIRQGSQYYLGDLLGDAFENAVFTPIPGVRYYWEA